MDGGIMSSTRHDLIPAKKVFLYRNGITDTEPKCMVVNERQIRDFSTFMNRATSGLRAPVAIRNIYTPAGGHKIKKLDDLHSGKYYVAGGTEHFKKVKYGGEMKRLLTRRPPQTEFLLPDRGLTRMVIASARYKRPIEKPCVIHVFRNGDERYRGARILIPRRMMGSWEYVLEMVTQKSHLVTPAKRLCTLDGRLLHAVTEIQDGGRYVALEGSKGFQKVSYCAVQEKKSPLRQPIRAPTTVTKAAPRLRKFPPRPRAAKQQEPVESKPPPRPPKKLLERRKSRPFAGRKNKEGREKAIEDHRADSVFGGTPVRRKSPIHALKPVADNGLLIAKTLDTPVPQSPPAHTSSSPEAGDVAEDLDQSIPEDTTIVLDDDDVEEVLEQTDQPLSEEPQEVPVDTEGPKYGAANHQTIKELESQPLQTSFDLSLQRNNQDTTSRPASSQSKALTSRPVSSQSKALTSRPVSSQSKTLTSRPVSSQSKALTSRPASTQSKALTSRPVSTQSKALTSRPASSQSKALASRPASSQSNKQGSLVSSATHSVIKLDDDESPTTQQDNVITGDNDDHPEANNDTEVAGTPSEQVSASPKATAQEVSPDSKDHEHDKQAAKETVDQTLNESTDQTVDENETPEKAVNETSDQAVDDSTEQAVNETNDQTLTDSVEQTVTETKEDGSIAATTPEATLVMEDNEQS